MAINKLNLIPENNPLVSVVMTSYNHEQYIADAINGIISQSYNNIQLIVVDDGSSDASPDIIRNLAKNYGFIFIEKKNGGLVSTINEGFKYVKGEYVIFHGSDDVSVSDRIKIQISQINRFPSAGFLASNLRFIDECGRRFDILHKKSTDAIMYNFDDYMCGRVNSAIVSCMFRRIALEKVMPLDESLLSEDYQLFMKVTNAGFNCLSWKTVPVINYRVHKTGLSKTRLPSLMQAQLRMLEEYKDNRHYKTAVLITKRHIFSAMAVDQKLTACKFLIKNIEILNISIIKPLVKLVMPKRLTIIMNKIILKYKSVRLDGAQL